MGPEKPLPIPPFFETVDDYVDSLLHFASSSRLLQTLCGGVHILDFYTRSPGLYSTILPESWRSWFRDRDIMDILDLLMREDLSQLQLGDQSAKWRGGPMPPVDLVEYLQDVRKHLLDRQPRPSSSPLDETKGISRSVSMGMKVKKVHEVENFTRYVDRLTADIADTKKRDITHLVDFGSGQNYLGRALAAPPFSKHIVAVESKQHNIEGAKNFDVLAKLVPKPLVMRNKKEYRAATGQQKKKEERKGEKQEQGEQHEKSDFCDSNGCKPSFDQTISEPLTSNDISIQNGSSIGIVSHALPSPPQDSNPPVKEAVEEASSLNGQKEENTSEQAPTINGQNHERDATKTTNLQIYTEGSGSVQYVEHMIKDGDLSPVISQIIDVSHLSPSSPPTQTSQPIQPPTTSPNLMVISLHSCGNLVHHGLRSLLLNPTVSAVALIGCCYNLMTERLSPPTYKLPSLRPPHPRLQKLSSAHDPHGFPMSSRLATYPLPDSSGGGAGLTFNITARMMAVQAPQNWSRADSDLFFTRHFYRALLQRIFLDRGLISAPSASSSAGGSAAGHTSTLPPDARLSSSDDDDDGSAATPLTIGTLRRFAYADFVSYTRAAVRKLSTPNSLCGLDPGFVEKKMGGLSDDEIRGYEERFWEGKKELSVLWALMAYSAGVVEAVVVVDRWVWLREQEGVGEAWVEAVFGYGVSPRNLVVVGVKK
ncbi:hypothetical protein EJ04DRAFT_544181 [Polyplosphaeria fusca]|uniref:Methyltransferase domain-containing protein n=1 Tax=Polyplosphaeria fusca TaxID=682080 RepID=A0A9P4V1N0_9PLEO|nr:hypothetical protein EJ04DRAFT_544181 [Polyplosphaeria fusca]